MENSIVFDQSCFVCVVYDQIEINLFAIVHTYNHGGTYFVVVGAFVVNKCIVIHFKALCI